MILCIIGAGIPFKTVQPGETGRTPRNDWIVAQPTTRQFDLYGSPLGINISDNVFSEYLSYSGYHIMRQKLNDHNI